SSQEAAAGLVAGRASATARPLPGLLPPRQTPPRPQPADNDRRLQRPHQTPAPPPASAPPPPRPPRPNRPLRLGYSAPPAHPPTRLAGGCFRPLSHLPDKAVPSLDSIHPRVSPYLAADGCSRRTRRASHVGAGTQDGVRHGARLEEQGLVHACGGDAQRVLFPLPRLCRAARAPLFR